MIEYVVVYPWVVDIAKTQRLPLVLKKRPEHLEGMLNLPGGKINEGESIVDAAVRELLEETGLEQVQDYDPMCYCPAEHLGTIQGTKSLIHCVRVPIVSRQELKPGATEDEEVKWYSMPDLLRLPSLMPNLRLVIPLMDCSAKDWIIRDLDSNWRQSSYHKVTLVFAEKEPMVVQVRSCKFYELEEEE